MKIKDYKCNCGHNDFFFADKGNQIGIYCKHCGKWFKWANKAEQNLTMKQVPTEWEKDHEILKAYSDGVNEVLDKIRSEIEQAAFEDVNGSKYIFVNRVIQIIGKYKEYKSEV